MNYGNVTLLKPDTLASGTLDPSLAGPSSFTTTLNGYTTEVVTALLPVARRPVLHSV